MRVVTNKKLAHRNREITKYLFIGTFAALVLGFIFMFVNSDAMIEEGLIDYIIPLQVVVLFVAFILTITSTRMTNIWARRPFSENAIEDGLKGLSNKSILYNYYHFPARHVLICPQGVFAIITRWHDQEFTVEDGKFSNHKNVVSKFFSLIRFDGIGKPYQDADIAREHVQKTIDAIAPDVEVKPLIVFIDPNATLHVNDSPIPVLYADPKMKPNLKNYMRDINRELAKDSDGTKNNSSMPLTDEQIEAFEQATITQ